jgi:hypothetical protein
MGYLPETHRFSPPNLLDIKAHPTLYINGVEVLSPENLNTRALLIQLLSTLGGTPYEEETLRRHLDLSVIPPALKERYFYETLRDVSRYAKCAGLEVVRTTMPHADNTEVRAVILKPLEK